MIVRLLSALVSILLLVQIGSFCLNRTTLFLELNRQYEEQRQNDIYTANAICQNEEIRRGMGEKNSNMCKDLEERINLNPKVAAIRDVLAQTYLCGEDTCSSYIKDSLSFLLHDWKASVVFTAVLILIIQCSGCFRFLGLKYLQSGRGRKKSGRGYASGGICIRGLREDLPFNRLTYPEQYAYSTNDQHERDHFD